MIDRRGFLGALAALGILPALPPKWQEPPAAPAPMPEPAAELAPCDVATETITIGGKSYPVHEVSLELQAEVIEEWFWDAPLLHHRHGAATATLHARLEHDGRDLYGRVGDVVEIRVQIPGRPSLFMPAYISHVESIMDRYGPPQCLLDVVSAGPAVWSFPA